MVSTETKPTNDTNDAEPADDNSVTGRFREALTRIRDGLGELASDLKWRDLSEEIGEGTIQILGGIHELAMLDGDIERMEQVWQERAAARALTIEAQRMGAAETEAEAQELAQRIRDRIDRNGGRIVFDAPAKGKKSPRRAAKARAA
jgi:hypothetical protein